MHVPFHNRHRAAVPALCFLRVERDEVLGEIHPVPSLGEEFAQSDTRNVRRYK